jgi:hypothetical protein
MRLEWRHALQFLKRNRMWLRRKWKKSLKNWRRLGNFEMPRGIIIACKPYQWKQDFPPSIEISQELAGQIKEKWRHLFTG